MAKPKKGIFAVYSYTGNDILECGGLSSFSTFNEAKDALYDDYGRDGLPEGYVIVELAIASVFHPPAQEWTERKVND